MSDELITLIIMMREAQKEDLERHTRTSMMERTKYETRVDMYIQRYMAERVQLDLWTRSTKSTEEPGAYNVDQDDQAKKADGT